MNDKESYVRAVQNIYKLQKNYESYSLFDKPHMWLHDFE